MSSPVNTKYGIYLRSLGGRRPEVPADYFLTPVTSRSRTTPVIQEEDEMSDIQHPRLFSPDEEERPPATEIVMAQSMGVTITPFYGKPGERGYQWMKTYSNLCKSLYNFNEERVKMTFPFHLKGQAAAWYQTLSERHSERPRSGHRKIFPTL